MSFDIAISLRRLKPQKRLKALRRRPDSELDFLEAASSIGSGILLDTTVYIDTLQRRIPGELRELLRSGRDQHSSVAVAELSRAFGRLDPRHAETEEALSGIMATVNAIPSKRITAPSVQAMIEANIVAGTIARLRGLPRADRQPLMNDVMLFLQALENGWTLVSRNIADLDIVQQIVPAGRVLLYRQTP